MVICKIDQNEEKHSTSFQINLKTSQQTTQGNY